MKKIFLTGASSGIGRATAEALAGAGHHVWGTSRDVSRVPALPNIHAVRLDLHDRSSVCESFATSLSQAGGFDVLINNAGSGHFGRAEDLSAELLEQQFQMLVFAHVELCRLALEMMKQQQHGLIINVTSLAARLPVPYMAAYNAAKAAMASFTMSMQLELAESRIRIVDLQPGDISTSFNDSVAKEEAISGATASRVERVWTVVDRNMRQAPKPDLVAQRIVALIDDAEPPPRVTVGDTFQAAVAPFIYRLLPQRVRLWGLRRYYGI